MVEGTANGPQDRPPQKTVWDVLDLLIKILVPVTIALVGWKLANAQFNGQQEAEMLRAQQSTLQGYFDTMQTLLLDRHLRHDPNDKQDARNLARARTITALDALAPARKRRVLRFLYETELIQARTQNQQLYHPDKLKEDQQPIVSLKYANLTDIDLSNRRLLSRTDLQNAVMNRANLKEADLSGADLTGAHLSGAQLKKANLTKTNLEKAKGITAESLYQQADSLAGATMPNGQTYEDWIKDRESRGEDGEKE